MNQTAIASGAGCYFGGSCAPESSILASSFSLADRGSARHYPAVPDSSGRVYRGNYCRASGEAWRKTTTLNRRTP